MYQHSFDASTDASRFPGGIDDALWEEIDAAVGESARLTGAVMIEGRGPQGQIMVVVVERRSLPGNADLRRRFSLTPRESEVARLMADRLSNGEIARRLGISLHTARRHSERVLFKLAIHNRNQVRTSLQEPCMAPAPRHARGVA